MRMRNLLLACWLVMAGCQPPPDKTPVPHADYGANQSLPFSNSLSLTNVLTNRLTFTHPNNPAALQTWTSL